MPGVHSLTYGGNPLGRRVEVTALQVIEVENSSQNVFLMGYLFRDELKKRDFQRSCNHQSQGSGLLMLLKSSKEIDIKKISLKLCFLLKSVLKQKIMIHGNFVKD